MEIKVYNCQEKVVGTIHLSARGWDSLKAYEGGEGLREAFTQYRLNGYIPYTYFGHSKDEEKESFYTYRGESHFGDKKFICYLDGDLRDYGEYLLYWTNEQKQKLLTEYEILLETMKSERSKAA